MELIDKSALVVEVEKKIKEVSQIEKASYEIGLCDAYKIVLRFLDTLEVKEVDLEKETKKWWKERLHLNPENQLWMDAHQSVVFAKHFFELGIRSKATKVSELIKKHFEETPQEELDKEWKEIEPLNDIGPDALEYIDKIKKMK